MLLDPRVGSFITLISFIAWHPIRGIVARNFVSNVVRSKGGTAEWKFINTAVSFLHALVISPWVISW